MSRRRHRHDVARPTGIGEAYLSALASDLERARSGVSHLADLVEEGRAAGRNVSSDELRLGELVATVGMLANRLDALRAGVVA